MKQEIQAGAIQLQREEMEKKKRERAFREAHRALEKRVAMLDRRDVAYGENSKT